MRKALITLGFVGLLGSLAEIVQAATLDDIRQSGTFKIGYRADVPPFSSLNDDGQPAGFSIDICRRIAARIDEHLGMAGELTVEFVPVTAGNRLQMVAKGRAHIECGVTTSTLSRQEIVDFSNLFYVTGASLLTTLDSGVETALGLAGKGVAVVANTTTVSVLTAYLDQHSVAAKVQVVDDYAAAMALLVQGKVHAVAGDQATLLGLAFASAADINALRLTADMLSFEPYAFPLPRNDADFRLAVNRALSHIYASGQVGQLWEQWFGRYSVKPTQLLLTLYRLNSLSD